MRLYSGRYLKNKIRQMQDLRTESRDAVIYDVDYNTRIARVYIQGTDQLINARWPENWEQTPFYLKPGNVVRITHPAGNRGRVELMGLGYFIPTTATGLTPEPPVAPEADGILTGCLVSPTSPTSSMNVLVGTGTYRIDGTVYDLAANSFFLGNGMLLGTGVIMGNSSAILTIAAASATEFRYDSIVAGEDGVPHVVQGTPAATNPVMPTTPVDHLKIAHVLVHPLMTSVESHDINAVYTTPSVSTITIAFSDNPLHGHSIGNPHWDDHSHITVTVRDQYGNAIGAAYPGLAVTFDFTIGNGNITYGGTSFNEGSGQQVFYTTDGIINLIYYRLATTLEDPPGFWTYTRNGESSPMFRATVTTTLVIEAGSFVLELWNGGDEIQF